MIGERLKSLRKKKKLSQKELANSLGTSQGYICDIEQGKKLPGSEFLISLKSFFDIDLNWFLTGAEPQDTTEPQMPHYRPEDGDLYTNELGKLFDIMGEWPEALKMLQSYLELSPKKQKLYLEQMMADLEETKKGG